MDIRIETLALQPGAIGTNYRESFAFMQFWPSSKVAVQRAMSVCMLVSCHRIASLLGERHLWCPPSNAVQSSPQIPQHISISSRDVNHIASFQLTSPLLPADGIADEIPRIRRRLVGDSITAGSSSGSGAAPPRGNGETSRSRIKAHELAHDD